ncbi:MAG: sulfite oxidase, partial [Thermomicrobiales bacterium]
GWGGIASTKWLVGLEVIDHPFAGHFNVESYIVIDEGGQVLRPVQQMPAKSVITNPVADTALDAGTRTLSGYAWSGYAGIATVEASIDGGANWAGATITDEAGPRSWVRFEYSWEAIPGPAQLASRATDERGVQQPVLADWNAKGYQMNEIFDVPVTVN